MLSGVAIPVLAKINPKAIAFSAVIFPVRFFDINNLFNIVLALEFGLW